MKFLNLSAIPKNSTQIVSLDMDLTLDCNLRCVYCFKEKKPCHMLKQTAFDAVVWLIHASGSAKSLRMTFMGGEPLVRFDLIKELVPFAKRRVAYHGKRIHFSMTTNNTLATDEVVTFWKKWGMGFHCSIDGIPEVQNHNRPTITGGPSSRLAEEGIRRILQYQPNVCARCTVVPDNLEYIVPNYKYFRSLGFIDIAMVPGNPSDWDDTYCNRLEEEFAKATELVMEDFRQGTFVRFKFIDDWASIIAKDKPRRPVACGAGRGMLLLDVDGNLWPCHRWNKECHKSWKIGSIYEDFSEEARKTLDICNQAKVLNADCETCEAKAACAGGCLAENLEETHDVYTPPHTFCSHARMFARLGRKFHDTMKSEKNAIFIKHYYGENNRKQEKEDK